MVWHSSFNTTIYDTSWSIWYDILRTNLPPTTQPNQYDVIFFIQVKFIFVDHSIAWLSSYKSTTDDAALSRCYDILRSSLLPTIQPNQYDKTFFVQVYHLRYSLINMMWYSSYKSTTYDTAWSMWYDIVRASLSPTMHSDQYVKPTPWTCTKLISWAYVKLTPWTYVNLTSLVLCLSHELLLSSRCELMLSSPHELMWGSHHDLLPRS